MRYGPGRASNARAGKAGGAHEGATPPAGERPRYAARASLARRWLIALLALIALSALSELLSALAGIEHGAEDVRAPLGARVRPKVARVQPVAVTGVDNRVDKPRAAARLANRSRAAPAAAASAAAAPPRRAAAATVPASAVPARAVRAVPARARPRGVGETCETFRVGDRKDFLLTMAPILIELGLCPADGAQFDVYWGYALNAPSIFSSPQLARRAVPPDALFNSVPLMLQTVGEKSSIATLQSECEQYVLHRPNMRGALEFDGWCSFTQRGFNVRRDTPTAPVRLEYARLRTYTETRARRSGVFPGTWILKSVVAYSQRGIQLVRLEPSDVRDISALVTWAEVHVPRGDYTLQEYLATPRMWRDRKWDMRALALVTSVEPLRFYALDHAFPKIATKPYTLDIAQLKDSCVHFRMPVCEAPVTPYPRSTDSPILRDNIVPPLARGEWEQRLYPALYKALLRVVLLARRQILPVDDELARAGFVQRRVQVLQPDVIFDRAGNAFVIEMNTNGFMVGALHAEFFDATAQMRSAVEIAGVNRYPLRPNYAAAAARLVDAHCDVREWEATAAARELREHRLAQRAPRCDALARPSAKLTEREVIDATIDEWCHTGRWLPIWPPRDGAVYRAVRRIYADVSRDELRARYWTRADGVLLRFARWLRLDAVATSTRAGVPGSATLLAFCGAQHQRAIENRTIEPTGCTCAATRRPPDDRLFRKALKRHRAYLASSAGEADVVHVAEKDAALHLLTKVAKLNSKRFPPGYRGLPYNARHDNGQTTPEFEEYDGPSGKH